MNTRQSLVAAVAALATLLIFVTELLILAVVAQ